MHLRFHIALLVKSVTPCMHKVVETRIASQEEDKREKEEKVIHVQILKVEKREDDMYEQCLLVPSQK